MNQFKPQPAPMPPQQQPVQQAPQAPPVQQPVPQPPAPMQQAPQAQVPVAAPVMGTAVAPVFSAVPASHIGVDASAFLEDVEISQSDITLPYIKIGQSTGEDVINRDLPHITNGCVYINNDKTLLASFNEKFYFNCIHYTKNIIAKVYDGNVVGMNALNLPEPTIYSEPYIENPNDARRNSNTIQYDFLWQPESNTTITRQVEYTFFVLPYDRETGQPIPTPHRLILSKTNTKLAKELVNKVWLALKQGRLSSPFDFVYSTTVVEKSKTSNHTTNRWGVFGAVEVAGATQNELRVKLIDELSALKSGLDLGEIKGGIPESANLDEVATPLLSGQVPKGAIPLPPSPRAQLAPPVPQHLAPMPNAVPVQPMQPVHPQPQAQPVHPQPQAQPVQQPAFQAPPVAQAPMPPVASAVPQVQFSQESDARSQNHLNQFEQVKTSAPTLQNVSTEIDEGAMFPDEGSIIDAMGNV